MPDNTQYSIEFGLGGKQLVAESRIPLSNLVEKDLNEWKASIENKGPEQRNRNSAFVVISQLFNQMMTVLRSDTKDDAAMKEVGSIASSLCRCDSQMGCLFKDCVLNGFATGTTASIIFKNQKALGTINFTQNNSESFPAAIGAVLQILAHGSFGKVDSWGTTSEWIVEQRNQLTALSDQAINSKTALDESQKLYETQVKLRASDSYWSKRASRHCVFGYAWLLITFLSVAGSVAVIYWLANQLIESSVEVDLTTPAAITKSVAFATITGIVLWVIRFCAKTYSTHRHIQYDAAERVTMVSSYLAFMNDSDSVSSDHLDIILRALFRPGSDGLIKDETGPMPTGIEIIQRSITR